MTVVEVGESNGMHSTSVPKPLFYARISGNPWEQFDVSGDGRFVVPVPMQEAANEPITVIVNGLKH